MSAVREEGTIAKAVEAMYGATRWGDRALYHGTSYAALRAIAQAGIAPRGSRKGNWEQSVKSNPNAVYLTSAYPLHFCIHAIAEREERVAIIEVNVERLGEKMQADEDAIEQALRGRDSLPKHWDMVRRTAYYRARAHLYRAEASLAVLGTCAYRGTIEPKHLERVAVIDFDKMIELQLAGGLDPMIHIMNYHACGADYRDWLRWLFSGDKEPWMMPRSRELLKLYPTLNIPSIEREGIRIYDSITEALVKEK